MFEWSVISFSAKSCDVSKAYPYPRWPASMSNSSTFRDIDGHGGKATRVSYRVMLIGFVQIFDKIRKEGGYKYLPGLERVKLE